MQLGKSFTDGTAKWSVIHANLIITTEYDDRYAAIDHTHPTGTSTTAGNVKLYDNTGNNTDGTINQSKLTEIINGFKTRLNTLGSDLFSELLLTNSNYKMSDLYPSTYQSMTSVPDTLDIDNLTTMRQMFNGCSALTTIPQLDDTSNVNNMYYMFAGCPFITTIPQINTSNVTNMGGMFRGCSSLNTVPLLNISKVTNMYQMFMNCTSLTTVPQFNTSSADSMIGMFKGCSSLTTVPQFNTSSATAMSEMFYGCTSLTTVPQLDTSNVTDMKNMFEGCSSLPTTFPWPIDCSSITDVDDMATMFKDSSITSVTLSNVDNSIISNITSTLLKGNDTLTINFV